MLRFCSAIALSLAACAAAPETVADGGQRIDEITAIGLAMADGQAAKITASAAIGASDPAVARLYGWPAEKAQAVAHDLAANDGRLGTWALAPLASANVIPGATTRIDLKAQAHPRWLYALAIDPLSQRGGGRFVVSRINITIRKD